MKSKMFFILFLFVMLTFVYAYAEKSSCVVCHTDENALKKLVKIPHLDGGEGEG